LALENARLKQERITSLTVGVGRRLDGVEQFHRLNVVKIDLIFKDNHETFPIQFDRQHGRGEG
jgi:hypothetical protein